MTGPASPPGRETYAGFASLDSIELFEIINAFAGVSVA
jgi:hypothetical protein